MGASTPPAHGRPDAHSRASSRPTRTRSSSTGTCTGRRIQFRNGLRLTDVIPSTDELRPNADLRYVLIRREEPGTRRVQAFSADLERPGARRTGCEPAAGPARPGLRVRPGDGPAPVPRADPGGAEAAGGEQRAVADRARRGPGARAGRVSARARHDRQRPDSRRRRPRRGGLRRRGGTRALRGAGRADAQAPRSSRSTSARAGGRRGRRPRCSPVRYPGRQGNLGVGASRRRSASRARCASRASTRSRAARRCGR